MFKLNTSLKLTPESWNPCCFKLAIASLLYLFFQNYSFAQTQSYRLFLNEFQFNQAIKDRWVSEIDVGTTFTSTPVNKSMMSEYSQFFLQGCLHNYYNSRWKLSGIATLFNNKSIPEKTQDKSVELRFAAQGIYFINKRIYTLSTKSRFEIRNIFKQNGYNDLYRFRQQLKFLRPFNSKIIRQGVFYFIASDEIFFKLSSKKNNLISFDRNIATIGFGYAISDDMQIELNYSNELAKIESINYVSHQLSFTFIFNNFIPNFKRNVNKWTTFEKPDEE